MNTESVRAELPAHQDDTAALLLRVLDAVEEKKRKRWVDIACAIVLSLTTVASAWCAYQSTLWSGVQTFRLAASNKASREASTAQMNAIQARSFDASMFISYLEAQSRGDKRMETVLFERFRPPAKKAIDAWLATDPHNNPAAPSHPFVMAEYVSPELEESKKHLEHSAQTYAGAQTANENADTYVLLTVLFASVLFFAGIAGTLDSPRLRQIIFVIAIMLFGITMIVLATMPICRE